MKLFSLIKSGTVHFAKKTKILRSEEFELLLSAQEILEKAKEEAKDLLKKTKEECKELKKQAIQDGLQQGLEQFNQQVLYLDQKTKQMQVEMQKHILPLTLKATKKVVGEELLVNPEAIVNIVRQAIRPVLHSQAIKIYVNKADLPAVEKQKDELKNLFEKVQSFSIEERSDLSQGSCIIETEVGIINATLDNQWRALESAFEKFSQKHR